MTKETVLKGVKLALQGVAGLGITFLCGAFAGGIAGTSGAGVFKRTCMAVGGLVVGGMLVKQAEKYISTEVDDAAEQYEQIHELLTNAAEKTPAGGN